MQVPISSSVAGVIGLSNTRESRLNASGVTADSSPANQATKPLEENVQAGDRDAQEQYLRGDQQQGRAKPEESGQPMRQDSMLDLPAQESEHHDLDLLG